MTDPGTRKLLLINLEPLVTDDLAAIEAELRIIREVLRANHMRFKNPAGECFTEAARIIRQTVRETLSRGGDVTAKLLRDCLSPKNPVWWMLRHCIDREEADLLTCGDAA